MKALDEMKDDAYEVYALVKNNKENEISTILLMDGDRELMLKEKNGIYDFGVTDTVIKWYGAIMKKYEVNQDKVMSVICQMNHFNYFISSVIFAHKAQLPIPPLQEKYLIELGTLVNAISDEFEEQHISTAHQEVERISKAVINRICKMDVIYFYFNEQRSMQNDKNVISHKDFFSNEVIEEVEEACEVRGILLKLLKIVPPITDLNSQIQKKLMFLRVFSQIRLAGSDKERLKFEKQLSMIDVAEIRQNLDCSCLL